MASRLSPELKAVFRHRIRHIHLPDLAPHYAPRYLPGNLRDFLESQITRQRSIAQEASAGDEQPEVDDGVAAAAAAADTIKAMRAWLRHASPPPTVLSFTRRPTYVLPAQHMRERETWEVQYLTASMKSIQQIAFPEPPGWSANPYYAAWEKESDGAAPYNPLLREWEPGVMSLPCAEPMYFGPGQLSIWPVIDLLDHTQRGKRFRTKFEFERILEDTTIQVLKREYGLDAFAIPGKTGVWVESLVPPPEMSDADKFGVNPFDKSPPKKYEKTRRIATVHADVLNNITRFGVSIHVGQPVLSNPWVPLRQDRITTSVVSELSLRGSAPQRTDAEQQNVQHRSDRTSLYLQTRFDEESPMLFKPFQSMPYSLVSLEPGHRLPTPMGLDNRDLSTAWTYEFARQLGLAGGLVDHVSMVDYAPEASALPVKPLTIGFKSRPVMGEDRLVGPYDQVEVPSIEMRVGGDVTQDIVDLTRKIEAKDKGLGPTSSEALRARSWPMYYRQLTDFLHKSIKGRSWDSRLQQLVRQQQVEASIDRRWQAIEEANVLRDSWRIYKNLGGYGKAASPDSMLAAHITHMVEDIKVLARGLNPGRVLVPKARLERKIARVEQLLRSLTTIISRNPDDSNMSVQVHQVIEEAKQARKEADEGSPDAASAKSETSLLRVRSDEIIKLADRLAKTVKTATKGIEDPVEEQQRNDFDTNSNPDEYEWQQEGPPLQKESEEAPIYRMKLSTGKNVMFEPVAHGALRPRLMPTRAERESTKANRTPDEVERALAAFKKAKLGAPRPLPSATMRLARRRDTMLSSLTAVKQAVLGPPQPKRPFVEQRLPRRRVAEARTPEEVDRALAAAKQAKLGAPQPMRQIVKLLPPNKELRRRRAPEERRQVVEWRQEEGQWVKVPASSTVNRAKRQEGFQWITEPAATEGEGGAQPQEGPELVEKLAETTQEGGVQPQEGPELVEQPAETTAEGGVQPQEGPELVEQPAETTAEGGVQPQEGPELVEQPAETTAEGGVQNEEGTAEVKIPADIDEVQSQKGPELVEQPAETTPGGVVQDEEGTAEVKIPADIDEVQSQKGT
ncbi:unnamed protein product [Discula destructiva]